MLEIIPGGILVDRFLQISFQRFPCPPSGVVETPPRSWGALPVARAGEFELLLPVERGEAVWIGVHVLQAEAMPEAACLQMSAVVDASREADAEMGFLIPPTASIEGIARLAGGWRAITGPETPGDELAVHHLRFAAVPSLAVQRAVATDGERPLHTLEQGGERAEPRVARCDSAADPQSWDVARRTAFNVVLLSGRAFAAASGLAAPEPLDATHVYGGWRLP